MNNRPKVLPRLGLPLALSIGVVWGGCGTEDRSALTDTPRTVTTSELVALLRSNTIEVSMAHARALKALETSQGWQDAEADRLECSLEAGECRQDVEATVDDLIEEYFDAAFILETTPTQTTYRRSADLGMEPYNVTWTLTSPQVDVVSVAVRLGDGQSDALTISLSPTTLSVQGDLGAFLSAFNMSNVMDDIDDEADILESLSGTATWTITVSGTRSVSLASEFRDLSFVLGFMDGAKVDFSSSGAYRVAFSGDGDAQRVSATVEVPPATVTFPGRLIQDEYLTQCDFPDDPCLPEATETMRGELFGTRVSVNADFSSSTVSMEHQGQADQVATLSADGTEAMRAELNNFSGRLESLSNDLFIEVTNRLSGLFRFDFTDLTHIFDVDPMVQKDTFTAGFNGRLGFESEMVSGIAVSNVIRVASGELTLGAQEIGEELTVSAGQCLLDNDTPSPTIPASHPFAHLDAGACVQ